MPFYKKDSSVGQDEKFQLVMIVERKQEKTSTHHDPQLPHDCDSVLSQK